MSQRTGFSTAITGWQHVDQPTADPKDALRASIHPTRQAVTLKYWGGGDALVLDVAHLDALVSLLGQVTEALAQPTVGQDDVIRAAATGIFWPGLSASVAPPGVLLALLLRVRGAAK